jgi:hypothetical protein
VPRYSSLLRLLVVPRYSGCVTCVVAKKLRVFVCVLFVARPLSLLTMVQRIQEIVRLYEQVRGMPHVPKEQGCENPWLFFVAITGPRAIKVR